MLTLRTFDEADIAWMKGSDEAFSFPLNLDVLEQLDGRVDVEMVGSTDACTVKQMILGKPLR